MLRRIGLAVLLMWLSLGPARADELSLPGLAADASTYTSALQKRFPAGGTAKGRATAEQAAAAAIARRDWPAAAAALESRVAMGEPTSAQWLDLAGAQQRRAPSDPKKALLAGWQAYQSAEAGEAQVAPLLAIAEALRALDRPDQAALALEQVVQRKPDDAGYARQLADARRAAGLVVRKVTPEGEADPPRACISFSVPPSRRTDFEPADWVKLDPAVPGAAITREGDQICVSGLPSGRSTEIVLRAGLPGEQDLALGKTTTLSVDIPNREPRIVFDTRLFVLPRGQVPAATMTTTNLSAVKLQLLRLTERNVPGFLRDTKLGDQVETYSANQIATDTGRVVWEGRAEVTHWEPNKPARTALPFPESLSTAGPGLYALVAKPGDGTQSYEAGAVQMILRTDLAPTVWRGSDGLTVQVRSYADAAVRPGARLQLLAHNNDILGEATTDGEGVARFPVSLLHGEGPLAPAVVHVFLKSKEGDEDFAALDLNVAAFDLADRGVAGQSHPGPLDAYVWLDRGIYRPGETVQVMALVRDNAGVPADVPTTIIVKRPNGQVFLKASAPKGPEASVHLPVTLSAGAAVGTWTVELHADPAAPAIGQTDFRVDAFVPDRMAVDIGTAPAAIIPGVKDSLPVTARFLYGAPGAGLSGKWTLRLLPDPNPFADLADYHFGLEGEAYVPERTEGDLPETDAQGHTAAPLDIIQAPDTTMPLKAEVNIEIADPSGHGSRASADIPVRAAGPLIGIRPVFKDGAVDAGTEAAFDVLAVSPEGKKVPLAARMRLVRERPDWRIVFNGRLARYETVWRDEPLETRDLKLTATPTRVARTLPFGRYRLEVSQNGGLAATSYRFYSGWASTDSPDVPDKVDVSVDRREVPAGQTVKVHIAPPFAGEATLAVLSDRVHSLRNLTVPAGGMDVDVPVDAAWGPGAYMTVHVWHAGDGSRPSRAIGLAWVGVDPAARKLELAIDTPEKVTPRAQAIVPVRTGPNAWVSLAVIDEGILRLTRFESPDPAPHFLGRRRLGLDIRDDWGRLLKPAEGESTELRQGGDEGGFVLPDIPQHTVILFTPPMQADASGKLAIPVDLPDFNGQVRLMAVGWSGTRIGAASKALIVRDAMVAEALLPRFLAPGDDSRLAVLLHSLDLPAGEAAVQITTEGPLSLSGTDRLAVTLAVGGQSVPVTTLHATGAGRGVVHLDVTGPGGFHVQHEAAITVRPSRGSTTLVAGAELAPGAELTLAVPSDKYIPGTWRASASFGAPVRYDAAALVRALVDYPLSCLEQATSRGFPLALLPDGDVAGPDRAGRLGQAVSTVLDRQRYDGGFGLWSASGEAQPWLSSYTMEFLLRARAAGAPVGEQAISDGLRFLGEAADGESSKPEERADQAYRLYVLALAGKGRAGSARVLAENIDELPTPLSRAQLGAALALAHDGPRAQKAFAAALDEPTRKFWYHDYGSALRDQAAIALLLKESRLLPDRLATLVAGLPGPDLSPARLSTQEDAWAAAVAGSLGRDGKAVHVAIDGTELPAPKAGRVASVSLTAPAKARNLGDMSVWQSVSITGVPVEAPPAAKAGMKVSRRFFNTDGSTLDLDHLKQNTVFVLLLEGRAEDGQEHRAMLMQGLPAGWEIANRLSGAQAAWLGELTDTEAEPAADDRYAAVMDLTEEKPDFRRAVVLRAVTPGTYEIPGAEVSDMYRPAIFARQGANKIKVFPLE